MPTEALTHKGGLSGIGMAETKHLEVEKAFWEFVKYHQKCGPFGQKQERLDQALMKLLSDDATAEYAAFKLTRGSQEPPQAGPSLLAKPARKR